jgi:VIT1/CCC1 family predicted Fe2+/Mn2+ transporter
LTSPHQTDAGGEDVAQAHLGITRERLARRRGIRDLIFGAQDGLLTTLGLVSGVSGAAVTRSAVLVAALIGATAGMLVMGAGAYISGRLVGRPNGSLRSWSSSSSRTASRKKTPRRWPRPSPAIPEAMLTAMTLAFLLGAVVPIAPWIFAPTTAFLRDGPLVLNPASHCRQL